MKASRKSSKAVAISREESDFDRIRAIENGLHEKAASILGHALRAPEINPGQTEIPAQWLQEMTQEEAERALRIANAAWASQKEAAAMKARAHENQGPRTLNATIVQMSAPMPVFPERIVSGDDDDK